jgi:predicted RNA-binding Zn ribbon-like protein
VGVIHVAGNLALDFVGTLNERWTKRVEHLNEATDLSNWLVGAGVLDEPPTPDADTLREAVALRESLFTIVQNLIDAPGQALPQVELDVVNQAAAHPPPTIALSPDGSLHREGTWRAGLSAVARDGLALTDTGGAELKWCADPECTHPFLDRSHGHRRRWCEMAGCGDRAKAAAYRARRRAVS